MSDIEKEFFETFGIEPKQKKYFNSHVKDGKIITDKKEKLKSEGISFECGYVAYPRGYEYISYTYNYYPTITSDIVLGLEEIILNKLDTIQYTKKGDNHYYVECNEYVETYGTFGKTRKDSLLQLCIKLKPEISEEVKALFKC